MLTELKSGGDASEDEVERAKKKAEEIVHEAGQRRSDHRRQGKGHPHGVKRARRANAARPRRDVDGVFSQKVAVFRA